MKRVLALWRSLARFRLAAQVLPGHRLPEGPERPVRDRAFHIEKYVAELPFDMAQGRDRRDGDGDVPVAARAADGAFARRRAPRASKRVERDGTALAFTVDPKAWKLNVALGEPRARRASRPP